MAVSNPAKLSEVQTEVSATSLANAGTKTLNDCSSGGDIISPYNLSNWAGYDDDVGPSAPTGLSFHPGNSGTQDGNAAQDTHVYISWDPGLFCADKYDVLVATSCGGTYSVISNDQVGLNYTYDHPNDSNGASRWIKVRGISNTGGEGTLTSCLEVKTAPTKPQSPTVSLDDFDCSDVTCTMNWNNGTSPGTRSSKISYRWAKNGTPSGTYTTEVGSYGATSFAVSVGSATDFDTFTFEWYYHEEGSSQTVTATTRAVACPI